MHLHERIIAISLITLVVTASSCFLIIPGQAQQLTSATPATLVGPICPGQNSVTVENSAAGATLALQINNKEQGHRSGAAGEVSLDIADPPHLSRGDIVQVAQQIGGSTTLSNAVVRWTESHKPSKYRSFLTFRYEPPQKYQHRYQQ
jgi:hypothetical protein